VPLLPDSTTLDAVRLNSKSVTNCPAFFMEDNVLSKVTEKSCASITVNSTDPLQGLPTPQAVDEEALNEKLEA
jgi:hypothetical protein